MGKGSRSAPWIVIGVLVVAFFALFSSTASANVTGDCTGSAVIDGETYTPANDTESNPVIIPDEDGVIAEYVGRADTEITNHVGSISIEIGPADIEVIDWGSANQPDPKLRDRGTYNIDDAYEELPLDIVGLFKANGEHSGEGGSCSGFVYVKFEGNPLSTVPGVVSVAGTAVAAAGLIAAAVAKKGMS